MEGLEKKISGDWFDIREISDSPWELEDFFQLKAADFQKIISDLRLSVEGGLIEYKRKTLLPIYSLLESMQYDSSGMNQLKAQAKSLSPLIYTILLQRLIAKKNIPLKKQKLSFDPDRKMGIKEIIQDVNLRLKENPALSKHPVIKNILGQVAYYKKELENMKQLSPNIPKEKAESISRNFKKTFTQIHSKIEEHYAALVKEEIEALHKSTYINILEEHDFKPLIRLYTSQAQIVSGIKSTLDFSVKEGFQTRTTLVDLYKDKDSVLRSFEDEKKGYMSLTGSETAAERINKAFCTEIIYNIDKTIKRLGSEPASE